MMQMHTPKRAQMSEAGKKKGLLSRRFCSHLPDCRSVLQKTECFFGDPGNPACRTTMCSRTVQNKYSILSFSCQAGHLGWASVISRAAIAGRVSRPRPCLFTSVGLPPLPSQVEGEGKGLEVCGLHERSSVQDNAGSLRSSGPWGIMVAHVLADLPSGQQADGRLPEPAKGDNVKTVHMSAGRAPPGMKTPCRTRCEG